MTPSLAKVQLDHLQRWAYIYVRQSDPMQVRQHHESTLRQYDLQARARSLGWLPEQIVVLDEDLGRSATDPTVTRSGFQKLLTEVALGRVGAIFNLEVSRLARQDSEWHRLVEVAALTGALLIDEHQVYDPRWPDDRLMLGLKGLLSSNETRQMGLRLWQNKLRKAQRGELAIPLPIGLVFDPVQGVRQDPDEQVRAAVSLLFERFGLSGSISAVVHYFQEQSLQFPKRARGAWQDGPVVWGPLTCQRVHAALHNPLYAGAYVYGRITHRAEAKPLERLQQKFVRLAPTAWPVVLWDAFPGYISRAEYEANQAWLQAHRWQQQLSGRRQDGPALLSGMALCGRCGRRLHPSYSGAQNQHVTYVCDQQQRRYAQATCQRIPGQGVDQAVATAVLAALTPAQVELSLAILDEMERQQAALRQQWALRLDGAHYATRLAQRRYEQVDPENRLVARTLEREWEAALQQVAQLEAEFARQQEASPLALDLGQRQQLLALAQDLSTVWQAETTSWTERKALLRLLVADVTLTHREADILVQIRWHTNEVDTCLVALPRRGAPPVSEIMVERVRSLSPTHSDQAIAEMLNQEGHQTARGKPFTAAHVKEMRRRYEVAKAQAA